MVESSRAASKTFNQISACHNLLRSAGVLQIQRLRCGRVGKADAMRIKPALITILLILGVSLLNVTLIIGNFAFAVMVGCVIGIVSFGVIFRQFENNIGKKIVFLILSQLAISCFSTIGLEICCETVHHQEWCN